MLEMPDLLRVKGEALASANHADISPAEDCFKQSLDLAKRQGALGFELRAAVSLARLGLQKGHHKKARSVLEPIYARFTEGFSTRHLRAAKELLDELDSPRPGSVAIN